MAATLSNVCVYDPAFPFRLVSVKEPGVDTWYDYAVITRSLAEKLDIPFDGEVMLTVSSGMYVRVPLIKIGIQVGNIKVDNVRAAVVEEGGHDLVIGRDVLTRAFSVGNSSSTEKDSRATVSSDVKDDPEALSIELHPIHPPATLKALEKFLQYERWLYNIYLISSREVKGQEENQVDQLMSDDFGIPESLQLKLTWVDVGSIWLTLKGCANALKYIASLFEIGTTAKLAQQMAESNRAETEAEIQAATRSSTVERIIAEQDRLKAENIGATYDAFRHEMRSKLTFMDELIDQLDDEKLIASLKEKKKEAILELAEQQILPIVRNVPRPYQPPEGIFLLPPSSEPSEDNT